VRRATFRCPTGCAILHGAARDRYLRRKMSLVAARVC
jgi:hypothetical protein